MTSQSPGGHPTAGSSERSIQFVVDGITPAEARSAVRQAVGGTTLVGGGVTAAGGLVLVLLPGDRLVGVLVLVLVALFARQLLIRGPAQLVATAREPVTWTVTTEGLTVDAADSSIRARWTRVAWVRQAEDFLLLRFRNGLTMVAPLRAADGERLRAVRDMARAGGVQVRGRRR